VVPATVADFGGGLKRHDAKNAKGRGILDFFTEGNEGGQLEGFSSGALAGDANPLKSCAWTGARDRAMLHRFLCLLL
jgi:hypothetical protein